MNYEEIIKIKIDQEFDYRYKNIDFLLGWHGLGGFKSFNDLVHYSIMKLLLSFLYIDRIMTSSFQENLEDQTIECTHGLASLISFLSDHFVKSNLLYIVLRLNRKI